MNGFHIICSTWNTPCDALRNFAIQHIQTALFPHSRFLRSLLILFFPLRTPTGSLTPKTQPPPTPASDLFTKVPLSSRAISLTRCHLLRPEQARHRLTPPLVRLRSTALSSLSPLSFLHFLRPFTSSAPPPLPHILRLPRDKRNRLSKIARSPHAKIRRDKDTPPLKRIDKPDTSFHESISDSPFKKSTSEIRGNHIQRTPKQRLHPTYPLRNRSHIRHRNKNHP